MTRHRFADLRAAVDAPPRGRGWRDVYQTDMGVFEATDNHVTTPPSLEDWDEGLNRGPRLTWAEAMEWWHALDCLRRARLAKDKRP